jgi:hypothetical protein
MNYCNMQHESKLDILDFKTQTRLTTEKLSKGLNNTSSLCVQYEFVQIHKRVFSKITKITMEMKENS